MFNLDALNIMEALKHDQYNLQYLFDKLPLGTVVTNRKGQILYFNPAQTQIDGLPAELALGKTEPEIYDFQDFPDIAQICQKRGRPILGFMWLYRTILGKTVNAAFWVFPLFSDNEVVGAICFTQPLAVSLLSVPSAKHPPIQWPEDEPIYKERSKMVGGNLVFQQALKMAQTTASSPSPVLIAGETGTGKEMFARYLHDSSPRSKKPFMAINCAAIPSNLLEGILFGTTKGSFTGAIDRAGLFEEANGGTVYLDEIDSMPLELQPKLLRVLQEMNVRRIGHSEEIDLDIKIVSSVGTSLAKLLEKQTLRPDLFYRLAVVIIEIPPLRHRLDDLDELLNHFINKYNHQLVKKCCKFHEMLMSAFMRYDWPGNVRELEHVVAGAINLADSDDEVIDFQHLPFHYRRVLQDGPNAPIDPLDPAIDDNWMGGGEAANTPLPQYTASNRLDHASVSHEMANSLKQHRSLKGQLSQSEKVLLVRSLTESYGNVAAAARRLGISRQLLAYKMEKYNLSRQQFASASQ